ncbi:MAG: hypothetical protein JJT89_16680 [Nitriliruptoraceae bacterium]|nr:hypothetical protein [Nitriliruptoraceae bacterium]
MTTTTTSVRRAALHRLGGTALGTALLLWFGTASALGHASGQIPHATWSSTGTEVTMELSAAPDDLADTVVATGRWDEDMMWAYVDGDIGLLPSAEEVAALRDDERLRTYLLDNVALEVEGAACPGQVHLTEDYITDGARFTFDCPSQVETGVITITLLHGQNASYRVFSIDGTEQYAAHTAAAPTHEWDFTVAQRAPGSTSTILAGVGLLAVLGLGGVLVVRWTRTRP